MFQHKINATFCQTVLVALYLFAILVSSCSRTVPEKPNLLFIMMDDLGYGQFAVHNQSLTVEAFDPYFTQLVTGRGDYRPEQALDFSRRAMPTLSELAREGMVFTRAFAPSNLCAPSRISIATGRMQQSRGIYINVDVEKLGPEPGSHLAHRLHDLGYATAHIGKWHIGARREQMVKEALKQYGINENYSYNQLSTAHPEVYEELRKAGYYGSVIDAHHPLENGFDYYYGYNNWASQFYNSTLVWENYEHAGVQPGYNTDHFTDKALEFMDGQIRDGQPFYVQLHYHAVHDSLEPKAPEKYFSKFPSDAYDLTNFYAHVYGVDANVKRILDFLEERNALENTLIVFTSDNGAQAGLSGGCGPSVLPGNAPFPGTKGSFFQGGMRVPLVYSWPAGIRKARERKQLVSTMDILPTLIDAAGGVIPEGIDGKSLLPLLTTDSDKKVHDRLLWAGIHSRAWGFNINKSFRDRGAERRYAPPAYVVVTDSFLLRYRGNIEPELYRDFPGGAGASFELYEYLSDPFESLNLVEEKHEVVRSMVESYRMWTKEFSPPVAWKVEKWEEIAALSVIETIAGTGQAGTVDGPALEAQLANPYGVIRGPDGALWFCEYDGHTVRKIDAAGNLITVVGTGKAGYDGDGGPAIQATLNRPHEIRFDTRGDLYIADMKNHAIRRVDMATGTIYTVTGRGEAGFAGDGGPATEALLDQPHSIQFGPEGNLYIADVGNHRVRVVDVSSGNISTQAGNGEQGPTPDGEKFRKVPLNGPRSLDFDQNGDLWLVLRNANQLFRLDLIAGTLHHIAGTGEKGFAGNGGDARLAMLSGPKGIAIAPGGNVFIADTESHTIRKIDTATGIIDVVAGTGKASDGENGEPLLCGLARPHGVFVEADGSVLIGDSENHRIRRYRPLKR